MIDSGVVMPGDAESSMLWLLAHRGTMPPRLQPQLSRLIAGDSQIVADWINSGAQKFPDVAPRTPITLEATLKVIIKDLKKLPDERSRSRQRYFTLMEAWNNPGVSNETLKLSRAALSKALNSLLHFDNERYILTDAVIMPNHVHLIAAFRDEESLLTQCTSWKHYTATQINRLLWKNKKNYADGAAELRMQAAPTADTRIARPKTEFWQTDQFDHLIRNEVDFDRYRKYIAENPAAAKLRVDEHRYYCKSM